MLELKLDNSVIPFSTPKFHLGQAVRDAAETTPGYIIGMQRDKYTWQYLVVAGTILANDAEENWYDEASLDFIPAPVKPEATTQSLDTLRIAS
jgi:hypothetical protein